MKKIKLLMLVVTFVISLVACSANSSSSAGSSSLAESTASEAVKMRIGSLKGPTTMGIVNMMYDDSLGKYKDTAEFTIAAAADELVTAVVKKELDIALVPANVASVLYKKTEGKLEVIDINTLGVLYAVTKDSSVGEIKDLEGKTVYMTGKGTTPEYVLRYLIKKSGIKEDGVDIRFCSEAAEVISSMAGDESSVGILPQPFVTTAKIKDDSLLVAIDLTAEWEKSGDGSMVTGVTVVRKDFISENPEAVEAFLNAHDASVKAGQSDMDTTAVRIEEKIGVSAVVAKKAYESCHVVCITGSEMKEKLSSYLKVLYDMDASAVGGELPGEDFYFVK